LAAALLALGLGAAVRADTPPATTAGQSVPAVTTPAPVVTDPVATTTTAPPPATTTAPATTTTTTTAPAATVPAATGPATPVASTLEAASAPENGCPSVGAMGILQPHEGPVVLMPSRRLQSATIAYPSDGAIVSAAGMEVAACNGNRPATGIEEVRSVSLFDGAVTAKSATVSLTSGASHVSGLRVNGRPFTLAPGRTAKLGNWGYLLAPDRKAASRAAIEIELRQDRAGLPAGTLVFIPYAQIALAPVAPPPVTTETTETTALPDLHDENFNRPSGVPVHKATATHEPLKVTPPLEGGPYTFPVETTAYVADTYGADRSDVPGGWHHGDDIFAPLGTPVVAVAGGTLNRVGWERLGGWRLWVRDRNGDEFYYAHLSGYNPAVLHDKRVHRGEVIGFVGNTGDAFTTLPHLHFEIHPRQLLHLAYDGAVDPTTYLERWTRPSGLKPPRPVLPRLPKAQEPRHEATDNFRELLHARGLKPLASHPKPVLPAPRAATRVSAPLVAETPAPSGGSAKYAWAGADAGAAVVLLGLLMWWRQRRTN
jgi:murein DD-endopeptidase MepM/ murein hydrolase activator NlpD